MPLGQRKATRHQATCDPPAASQPTNQPTTNHQPQSVEDYFEVALAYLDALRHAATPTSGNGPADGATAAGAGAATTAAGAALRKAFEEVGQLMANYFPDYLDRSLRWVCLRLSTSCVLLPFGVIDAGVRRAHCREAWL